MVSKPTMKKMEKNNKEFFIPKINAAWLNRSAVGAFRGGCFIYNLRKSLLEQGIEVRIHLLGWLG